MTHGSLFSGIGGFDLAAAWAGWTNVFNCEIDPFCRRVLKYHFPESNNMKMFKQQTLPFGEIASTCSPVDSPASHSVSRANVKARPMTATYGPQCLELFDLFGPAGLWARTFSESLIGRREWFSSRCVLIWRRQDTRCKRTLYQLRASVLPICDTEHGLLPTVQTQGLKRCVNRKRSSCRWVCFRHRRPAMRKQFVSTQSNEAEKRSRPRRHDFVSVPNWEGFPTESPICGPDDGLSAGLDGITFPAWCKGSIKAYGNAIVPQVALRIFETINEYEGL